MEQVELALDRLAVGARRKGCDLALVVDGDEVVVEQALDVALLADLLERGRVLGDAEHGCGRGHEGEGQLTMRKKEGCVG